MGGHVDRAPRIKHLSHGFGFDSLHGLGTAALLAAGASQDGGKREVRRGGGGCGEEPPRINVADFWTVFCLFNSRFDRWTVRWGVRGRQFRPFPGDFGGPGRGGCPGRDSKIFLNSFQKAATWCWCIPWGPAGAARTPKLRYFRSPPRPSEPWDDARKRIGDPHLGAVFSKGHDNYSF